MTQPLALICYERLLPGSQFGSRLRDLGYRVSTVTGPGEVVGRAEAEKPMVVIMDLAGENSDALEVIRRLRLNQATSHIPVLAFSGTKEETLHHAARDAGAALVAMENEVLAQLPQLLEHVLRVD